MGKLIRVEGLKQLRGVAGIETIGLDLGDRFSQFCAVGGKGEVLQEGRVPTTVVGMRGDGTGDGSRGDRDALALGE